MAPQKDIEEDLKQKKVNFDWLKKNNMDIADLVKMARKNKGQPMTDDSDEWIEEVIEDDDEVADDLLLTKKPAAGSFQIPKFHQKKPPPGPDKSTYRPPQFPKPTPKKSPQKKKEIDGSKLLLLQSAEKKIIEASVAYSEALKEGEAIVSLLEFMLANTSWDEDEYEEVDPDTWETRKEFNKSIEEAKSILDKLENAKHTLMGTKPKESKHKGPLERTDSKSDSPSKEADIPAPRPNLGMQREPSFREPSLGKIEEADNSSTSSEGEEEGPATKLKSKSPKTEKPTKQPPKRSEGLLVEDDGLAKAKNDFLKFATEGAALVSKLEKAQSPLASKAIKQTPKTGSTEDDLAKAKSEFLQFAQEGAALASKLDKAAKAPDHKEDSEESAVKNEENNDLAKAKNEFKQFAQEGAALASKLEKSAAPAQSSESGDSMAEAKNSIMNLAKDGAILAAKLDAKTKATKTVDAAENETEENEEVFEEVEVEDDEALSDIEKAKKMFLEAAKQGSSLVMQLESKIEKKKAKAQEQAQQSSEEEMVSAARERTQELEKADAEVAIAKDSFLELAKHGTQLMADLEGSQTEETDLTKSGDSFLSRAKEGAKLVANLEEKLSKLPHDEEESTPADKKGDSELIKAKDSFLAMAQEGADLVANLVRKTSVDKLEKEDGKDSPLEDDLKSAGNAEENAASNVETGVAPEQVEAAKDTTEVVGKPAPGENETASKETEDHPDNQGVTAAEFQSDGEITSVEASRDDISGPGSGVGYSSDDESSRAEPTSASPKEPIVETADDEATKPLETSDEKDKTSMDTEDSQKLTEARQSFLAAAKEGAALITQLEKKIEQEKHQESDQNDDTESDEDPQDREDFLAKARASFLSAAKEGAALVSLMESKQKKRASSSGQGDNQEPLPPSGDGNAASLEGDKEIKKDSMRSSLHGDALLNTSKGFLDAAHLVDMLDKSESKLSIKENDDTEDDEEEVIDEINDVDAAKKAFLQFAKEGSSLVSKLESRYTKQEQSRKDEEVDSDDEYESEDETNSLARAQFLEATKAQFLSFQKDMDKKLNTTSTTSATKPAEASPEIQRTASEEVEC